MTDRLDRIEQLLEQSSVASDERMTRIEQSMQVSNERLTRMEQQANERLTRIEQLVESNNRFLESFGQDLRRYTDNLDRVSQQLAASTATANQDRMETNTRLSAINRKVDAIANHLGVQP